MPESQKNALPAGHVIDKYRIGDVLGSGGFGIVYRGRHQELGLDVAIKEYLPPEIAVREGTEVQPLNSESRENYDEGMRRFLEEAKRLVQFNHPNVVRCRDFFRANGTAYLVMDYEDGLPLSELLRRREEQGNPLSGDEIKQVILPLLDGLAVVHAHDVLHRDIKPGNIFIRKATEQPVLIDFGAAKQGFSEHSKSVWAYTQGYAPMEQIEQGGKLGPWTDIYAIGAVMWRIVAGDNPPKAEDRAIAQVRGNPDPMTTAVELGERKYPSALLHTIDKCLSLQEKDRYQSAAGLSQALHKAKQRPHPREHPMQAVKAKEAPAKPQKSSAHKAQPHPGHERQEQPKSRLALRKKAMAITGIAASLAVAALAAYIALPLTPSVDVGNASSLEPPVRAERMDAEEQYKRGNAYFFGKGVSQDYSEAVRWWKLAAERGHVRAQNNLGSAYYHGKGVRRNYVAATRYWRLAAKRGYVDAQFQLGSLYDKRQNYREAYIWYSIAASSGRGLVRKTSVSARNMLAKKLSSAELSAAKSEVRRRLEAMPQ